VTFLQYYVSVWQPARWPLVLGVIFVLSVLFLPGGVGIYISRLLDMLRYQNAPRRAIVVESVELPEPTRSQIVNGGDL
jgi:hypothetical protein